MPVEKQGVAVAIEWLACSGDYHTPRTRVQQCAAWGDLLWWIQMGKGVET